MHYLKSGEKVAAFLMGRMEDIFGLSHPLWPPLQGRGRHWPWLEETQEEALCHVQEAGWCMKAYSTQGTPN